MTCSPCSQARGFPVHRRSLRHDSPKGLPGPLDVSSRVRIAVHDQPAGRADVRLREQVHVMVAARPQMLLVLDVTSGEEAIAAVAELAPDVLFLDREITVSYTHLTLPTTERV